MLYLVQNDDESYQVQLTRDGLPFTIDPLSTVTAGVVHRDTGATVGPVACDSAAEGAAWSSSLVIVEISSAMTALCTLGPSVLEIQIDDPTDGKSTFFLNDVWVRKDHI
jgi:hypothetical protein